MTADAAQVAKCTEGGVPHDYRPRTYQRWGKPHTSWVCVWCDVVACGDYSEPDPCWEPYHHHGPHPLACWRRVADWRRPTH